MSFRNLQGKLFSLLEYDNGIDCDNDEDFIILEGLKNGYINSNSKWVHIVKPSSGKKEFFVGAF